MDRRFGENDPTMTPEDKLLERYTQEASRKHRNSSMFDLEEDDEGVELTHMGQSLSLDGPALTDDFDEDEIELSDAEDNTLDEARAKRRRHSDSETSEAEDEEDGDGLPERKKTKQEVMKEIIAKSKLHKYERQAAKDDDEDMREELDKELSGIHALLRGLGPKPAPVPKLTDSFMGMNPERASLLDGSDKLKFEKEYDKRLRQLAQDARSKPTERSKTEDEKIAEDSRRLQELEAKRLRRMQGEEVESDEEPAPKFSNFDDDEDEGDNVEDYGLGSGIKGRKPTLEELGVEDEDDFMIDDDLVASGSDIDDSDEDSDSMASAAGDEADDEDADFIGGLLSAAEASRPEFLTGANGPLPKVDVPTTNGVDGNLAYTFACPESHEEFLEVTQGINVLDLPTVVQRIRALYHPKLKSENKSKLANFSVALVDQISHLANQSPPAPSAVIETLIRHIHSLSKTYAIETANAFRQHLEAMHESRPLGPTAGDLIILTAVGSIFPTSDHFHQVATPALLTMGRYLGQKIPQCLSDYATGLYLATLALQYQKLSKRFVPELHGFIFNTLCALSPKPLQDIPGCFVYHKPKVELRSSCSDTSTRILTLVDTTAQNLDPRQEAELTASLLQMSVRLLDAAADLWSTKPAFREIFGPALKILQHMEFSTTKSKLPASIRKSIAATSQKLTLLLQQSRLARRPLMLHNHKPLAIKTSIPKFEEGFNPDKHYDPDRERAESSKLKAEFKKERKGALRELRKDANFIARESLREKKERDTAYEKKYKRLVAEIQGEEGHESKEYEREKSFRKKGRK